MLNFAKQIITCCHPELVSGSYQIDVMTIKRKDSEINSE